MERPDQSELYNEVFLNLKWKNLAEGLLTSAEFHQEYQKCSDIYESVSLLFFILFCSLELWI